MSQPFQPLAALDKKPIVTAKKQGVVIRFNKPAPTDVGEPEAVAVKPTVAINDRRQIKKVDRDLALQGLRGELLVSNVQELMKPLAKEPMLLPKPVITKMPTQKLVLKVKSKIGEEPAITDERQQLDDLRESKIAKKFYEQNRDEEKSRVEEELQKEEEEKEEGPVGIDRTLEDLELKYEEDVGSSKYDVLEKPKPKVKIRIKGKKAAAAEEPEVDLTTAVIRTQKVIDRLPQEKEHIIMKASSYYMNNRKLFIQKLTDLFKPYKQELLDSDDSVTCEGKKLGSDFEMLTHQKIVRDYLNLYTPYRGLLLYHGLGAGKTCSAIAIAEGMKSGKRVFVLTPKSLKANFFNEMKKCGDSLYKRNQFWEFVSTEGNPEYVGILSRALSLSMDYIKREKGAWFINVTKEANFTELEEDEQRAIDKQLNEMIRSKYTDINYNGINMRRLAALSGDFTRNPFDNAVIVIDEAHNFVSRIVNKIKKPKSLPYLLYDYIMSAKNAKVVFLSGTPIINYPNEIGILYNMLRGYITTWTIPVSWEKKEKLNTDTILKIFDTSNFRMYDYVDYSDDKLTITRNPFGFVNTKKRGRAAGGGGVYGGSKKRNKIIVSKNKTKKVLPTGIAEKLEYEHVDLLVDVDANNRFDQQLYKGGAREVFDKYNGVAVNSSGNVEDDAFLQSVIRILKSPGNELTVRDSVIEVKKYKALPDDSASFLTMFVNPDTGEAINMNLFQRRILGLTSYFRSANEKLLPSFEKTEDGDDYHVVKVPMSEHQFGIYEKIRKEEADKEKQANKRKRKQGDNAEDLFTISSTYRVFSRAACNFTFPEGIERPLPDTVGGAEVELKETDFDAVPEDQKQGVDDYYSETDKDADQDQEELSVVSANDMVKYEKRIEKAMVDLAAKQEGTNESEYLSLESIQSLSPKFAKILENLSDETNQGLHLIYSHFRTIEGIGILKLLFEANGFAEFKVKQEGGVWMLDITEEDREKPMFALHTGTETDEEKEIILRVYNGDWSLVPTQIADAIRERAENNDLGQVIKALMITASGAEGINLKNTRYVHIVEPYWHMVRIEQVVGRARRICSHTALPEEMRTVKVFLYVSSFSEAQKTDEKNIELRIRDISRLDKKTPITTDESLYEIASIKQRINNQILRAVKESAIDCNVYAAVNAKKKHRAGDDDEKLVCYGFGKVESNDFSSYPTLEQDQAMKVGLDVKVVKARINKVTVDGVAYAMNQDTNELYNLESYQRAIKLGKEPVVEGILVKEGGKLRIRKV